jgi:hypothetical protein
MHVLRAFAAVAWLVAPSIAPAVAAPSAPVAPVVRTAPAAIDATGTRDVTTELQAFLDGVPNHGVAVLARGGVYRVEGTLVLTGRHDLRLNGNDASIVATTSGDYSRSQLRIVGGSNLVIDDLEIQGANPNAGLGDNAYQPTREAQHGIRLEGVTNIELVRVRVHDVFGDFVYIGQSADGQWSQGVWIHDSNFWRSGRQGLSVTAGRDVVIERNHISETRRATIDLEPNGPAWGAENVHILDNQVGAGRLLFIAAAGAGPVDRVVVARNRLDGHVLSILVRPPGTARRKDFYVIDNVAVPPATQPALNFTRVDGVVVVGNVQPIVRAGQALAVVSSVCGLVVSGNDPSPGTVQLAGVPPHCGTAPAPVPPPAPDVAGRPVSGAAPPTTTTTTLTPSTTAPTPAPLVLAPSKDEGWGWVVVVAITLGALVGVIVLLVGEARRKRGPRARTSRRS